MPKQSPLSCQTSSTHSYLLNNLSLHNMGLVFGKITVETPKYDMLSSTNDYEIRKYPPCVVAEVTYEHDPTQKKSNKDSGFTILANYIGALGNPKNTKPEKIAMTAPVITHTSDAKIPMTASAVTKGDKVGEREEVTMQFILPSTYWRAEDAPKPLDERVMIREEGERKYGVVNFNGVATDEVVSDKVEKLKMSLLRDGYKLVGVYLLASYNPPWTIPMYRTNEVMIPVE